MKFIDLFALSEARRNYDHPSQEKPYGSDKLEKYRNDYDKYISFTAIDKLGINPTNNFNTPIGIYTYPIAAYIEDIEDTDSVKRGIPFGGDRPFMWVVEAASENILDLDDYDSLLADAKKVAAFMHARDPDIDAKIAKKYAGDGFSYVGGMFEYAAENARVDSEGGKLWNVTRMSADMLSKNNNSATTMWNYILRVVLGYDIVLDSGNEIIHSNEPTQCLFLSIRALKVVEKIENSRDRTGEWESTALKHGAPKNASFDRKVSQGLKGKIDRGEEIDGFDLRNMYIDKMLDFVQYIIKFNKTESCLSFLKAMEEVGGAAFVTKELVRMYKLADDMDMFPKWFMDKYAEAFGDEESKKLESRMVPSTPSWTWDVKDHFDFFKKLRAASPKQVIEMMYEIPKDLEDLLPGIPSKVGAKLQSMPDTDLKSIDVSRLHPMIKFEVDRALKYAQADT